MVYNILKKLDYSKTKLKRNMKDEAIISDRKSSLARVKIILAAAEKVIQNMKYSIENTGFKKIIIFGDNKII